MRVSEGNWPYDTPATALFDAMCQIQQVVT